MAAKGCVSIPQLILHYSLHSMNSLFLVHNPKGGTGKSVVSCTAFQYHIDRGIPFVAFDTDRSNPDCWRRYQQEIPVNLAIFSEATRLEDAANQIFNLAMHNRVLVNMPAQVHQPLKDWIDKNDLLDIAPEVGVRFHFLFVTDAGFDSLNLLLKTMEAYQEKVAYTILRNRGRSEEWEALDAHEGIQRLARRYGANFLDFPALLGSVVRNRMDAESLSFGAALQRDDFSVIEKQRVRKFLREAYAMFDASGVFDDGE